MLINTLLMNKPIIHSKTLDEDILNLGAASIVNPDWVEYSVFRVSKAHVARPDLISQIVYGDDHFGDFICKVNNIPNPFEINEGDILIIPEVDSIPRFLVTDDWDDDISGDERVTKPVPKKKNEKRKANEAIVGDTRFKVDKDNRVIIY